MKQEKIKLKPIKEQVVVITGASSGIGLATAKLAARKGAKVVVSSRNESALDDVVSEINQQGGVAIPVVCDVSKYEDVVHLKDAAVNAFGSIDTWINNAGTSIYGSILEIPFEEEHKLFEVNFWGIRHGSRVAIPELVKSGGGLLINLGSEVSGRSIPLQGMYAATKHAIKAYTDALRMEIEKQGLPVAVTLVRPAGINTLFTVHATNHLDKGEPSLPDPVFHPDVVAKAIVKAMENPRRDVYIGGSARLYTLLDVIAPRWTDLMIISQMFKKQSEGTLQPHSKADESLNGVPVTDGMTEGPHRGKVKKSSLYTDLTVH